MIKRELNPQITQIKQIRRKEDKVGKTLLAYSNPGLHRSSGS